MNADRFLRIWLAVVVVALAIHLGGFPLLDADEGRNGEVGREMAATNDYVMPRLNTLPYLDKPVVYFAAEAAVMEVLGPTEVAARLPAYLFTLATAAVLFWFAKREWGGETPWIAAIIFLSTPLTVAFSRTVIFDSALTFFVVAALAAFYVAIDERDRRWSILAWASMGVAMITKGPVTFILVLFVVIPWAWRRRALRVVFPLLGLVLFIAVIAPWVWAVSQVVPEFLRYILVTETAERMATGALKRTGPPWYFVPYMLAGALPWSFVALFSWRKLKRPDPAIVYWLLAIAIPFVFFSLNQSKRPQYVLPLMPAIALVVARIWDEARTRAAAIIFAVLGVILLIAPLFVHRTKMQPELRAEAVQTAIALGIAFAVAAIVSLLSKRREVILAALSLPVIALPLLANPLLNAVGERRSAKSFVAELKPYVTADTEVIGVEAFTGSLAFYLQRPITLVTEDASELTSNYLIRRYDKFLGHSTLEPLPYFEQSLAASTEPRIYIVRSNDKARRALLSARRWRSIATGTHVVAYGR